MCVYVRTLTHNYTHPYTYTHSHGHVYTPMLSQTHVHTLTLTHTRTHTHTLQLFAAYQVLLRLWNHPACIVMMSHSENLKIEKTLALEEKKAKKDYVMVNGRLIKKGNKVRSF